MISQEDKRKILKERAKALAEQPEKKQEDEHIEIVEFRLAHEKYGIQSSYVSEIYQLKELTPVPCTPQFVAGIINVRGKILAVIDIKKFFELPGKADLHKIIIIHDNMMEFGILADAVLGTGQISIRDIQPSLPTLTGIHAQYLRGVTKEHLVVLDAKKILCDKKIIVHDEI
ncbi:MAG: chemotaxis protein CheW [Candidatus Methanoperedenaceae archaeon]|nr:MAG: chemotaxis protein CheW [Candidatus Methanoperedenaceae archaeon]